MPMAGITFKDTFFILESQRHSERLHFHELVHVAQWRRLGVDNFLRAYGVGLTQFGYQDSPLEQMAYALQSDFESDSLPSNLIDAIHESTDAIWTQVAPTLQHAGVDIHVGTITP